LLRVCWVYQLERPPQRPNFLNALKQLTLKGCSIFGEMFASADEGDRSNYREKERHRKKDRDQDNDRQ